MKYCVTILAERISVMYQIEKLRDILGSDYVKTQEPMKNHTTFRIGGPAKCYVEPGSVDKLVEVLQYLRQEGQDFFLLGNGSNLLVADEGVDGVVVATRSNPKNSLEQMRLIKEEDANELVELGYLKDTSEYKGKTFALAGCGILLASMASQLASNSLEGFEFASGIPGTLGGAVTMNAGAYGGEMKDVIVAAKVLTPEGKVIILDKEQLKLSYRHSIVQEEQYIVLEALFVFSTGVESSIRATMQELNGKRRDKQPLEYGSAGSTFKRPEGHFAGKLIQDAGLRGFRVGDVMVSEKHCGFVVNVGDGTSAQAEEVISHVQQVVQEKFGVTLETEVKRLPQ